MTRFREYDLKESNYSSVNKKNYIYSIIMITANSFPFTLGDALTKQPDHDIFVNFKYSTVEQLFRNIYYNCVLKF